MFLLFGSFTLLRGPLSSFQIITWRLILTYEYLALAWLISRQLFLNYPVYPLPISFYFFLYLSSYSMAGFVVRWLAPDIFLSFSVCSFCFSYHDFSSYLFSACQPHLFFFSVLLLAIQLFIRPTRSFRQGKVTQLHRVKSNGT